MISNEIRNPTVNSGPDLDRALALYRALCPDSDRFTCLVIRGEPHSKARPRFSGNGRVYTPRKQKAAENLLKLHFRTAFKEPLLRNLAVGCIFFRSSRHRIDVDNMLKHVMDAANEVIWRDDCQVTAQLGVVEYDSEDPRTIILIGDHDSSMVRPHQLSIRCRHCEEEFTPALVQQVYCSRGCASRHSAKRKLPIRTCPTCREVFQTKRGNQKYCSNECKHAARKGAGPKGQRPVCAHCGKPVSRREYTRCRECFRDGR